ncbi:hypothetical protein BDR07DRAFT_1378153 [Suillus spraguei]|nr:hypothetical protein BDR07DRAFT_1378153 [Suillus spraguei]
MESAHRTIDTPSTEGLNVTESNLLEFISSGGVGLFNDHMPSNPSNDGNEVMVNEEDFNQSSTEYIFTSFFNVVSVALLAIELNLSKNTVCRANGAQQTHHAQYMVRISNANQIWPYWMILRLNGTPSRQYSRLPVHHLGVMERARVRVGMGGKDESEGKVKNEVEVEVEVEVENKNKNKNKNKEPNGKIHVNDYYYDMLEIIFLSQGLVGHGKMIINSLLRTTGSWGEKEAMNEINIMKKMSGVCSVPTLIESRDRVYQTANYWYKVLCSLKGTF